MSEEEKDHKILFSCELSLKAGVAFKCLKTVNLIFCCGMLGKKVAGSTVFFSLEMTMCKNLELVIPIKNKNKGILIT